MFCKNCGEEVNENSRFCPKCGESLPGLTINEGAESQKTSIVNIGQDTAPALSNDTEEISELVPVEPVLRYGKYTDADKRNIKHGIITMAIGLIILLTVIIIDFSSQEEDTWEADNYSNQNQDSEYEDGTEGFNSTENFPDSDEDIVEKNLETLLSGYYDAYYRGDLDTLESYCVYPISLQERAYLEKITPYYSGYQDGFFIYEKGLNEGDYLVYIGRSELYTGIDTPCSCGEVLYVETNPDGKMHINNLYSNFNLITRMNLDGWDEDKYNLLMSYVESDEIAAEMEKTENDYQEALASDSKLENMVNEMTSIVKEFAEEYLHSPEEENSADHGEDDWTDYEEENNAYILPDSSDRELTEEDLQGLSKEQLRLARNEIYARHGRIFQDETLKTYFEAQDWYVGSILPEDFSDTEILTDLELDNANFILQHED